MSSLHLVVVLAAVLNPAQEPVRVGVQSPAPGLAVLLAPPADSGGHWTLGGANERRRLGGPALEPRHSGLSRLTAGALGAGIGAATVFATRRVIGELFCDYGDCAWGSGIYLVTGAAASFGFVIGWNLGGEPGDAGDPTVRRGAPMPDPAGPHGPAGGRSVVPVTVWLAGNGSSVAALVQVPLR